MHVFGDHAVRRTQIVRGGPRDDDGQLREPTGGSVPNGGMTSADWPPEGRLKMERSRPVLGMTKGGELCGIDRIRCCQASRAVNLGVSGTRETGPGGEKVKEEDPKSRLPCTASLSFAIFSRPSVIVAVTDLQPNLHIFCRAGLVLLPACHSVSQPLIYLQRDSRPSERARDILILCIF